MSTNVIAPISTALNRRLQHSDLGLDPYFWVDREKLLTSSGEYVGFDALINKKLGKTMSVVGESYNLVPHKRASKIIHQFLDDAAIPYQPKFTKTAHNGSQYFEVVDFPDLKFNVALKGKDTALDNDGSWVDEYTPAITIRNSYDKTYPVQFVYGAYRYICTNGVMIGNTINKLSIRHNQIINIENLRVQFKEDLEKTIEGMKITFPKLNSAGGQDYAEAFLFDKTLPAAFKKAMVELMSTAIICNYNFETSAAGRTKQVLESFTTSLSAYAVLNVITQLNSHNIKNAAMQQMMFNKISRVFGI